MALVITACGADSGTANGGTRIEESWPVVSAEVSSTVPFAVSTECDDTFGAIDLDHVTAGTGNTASTFDGTGAGVAAGDLDGDGDDDLVIPNLSGGTSLFENTTAPGGPISFNRTELIRGRFRQAAVVDVDGDRRRDIVLTTGIGTPTVFWNNGPDGDADGDILGPDRFERDQLPGVAAATYSLAWGDLTGDGDLDLVTGSYNAELTQLRNSPLLGSDTGVIVHQRTADGREAPYEATRIAAESQALSIRLVDLDGDRSTDIWVGNDLATPDGVWTDNDGGWLPRPDLLTSTAFSTMSVDAGDVDNDGRLELFATDMMPMSDDPENLERYIEVTEDMEAMPVLDDIQHPANVLLDPEADADAGDSGRFDDLAADRPIQATGWSWSGLFGDLDSDGLLDLYVVNGMRSDELFRALPDNTLIEPNQAFRNGEAGLVPAPEWGLGSTDGGRGLVMADLDLDGDLDMVVNNLGAPARVLENRLCTGSELIVSLDWPVSSNPDAIGAVVEVTDADGKTLTRTIDATRGYLSGGPLRAHFGLGGGIGQRDGGSGADAQTVSVVVLWPDGRRSNVDGVPVDHGVTITRG